MAGTEKSKSDDESGSFLGKLKGLFDRGKPKPIAAPEVKSEWDSVNLICCSDRVHIAYRGVSDDRLYLAENRTTNEVKFFRPIGLRVYCAVCRKRLY